MQNPGPAHYAALKRVLRYLLGTMNYGIVYDGKIKGGLELWGYADADWAGDPNDRRSTTGYIFNLCGGPVSWQSSKQQTVAMSTVEAEYQAGAAAAREALWIRQVLRELEVPQEEPTRILEDNQGCISSSKNPEVHSRSKHIDIKHHFLRERVETGEVRLEYCSSERMTADLMTKALTSERFRRLRKNLNMVEAREASA